MRGEKPFLPTSSYLSAFKPGQKTMAAVTTAQFATRKENEIKYPPSFYNICSFHSCNNFCILFSQMFARLQYLIPALMPPQVVSVPIQYPIPAVMPPQVVSVPPDTIFNQELG